jgi:SAM-dependent methyltransferase
MSGIIRETRDEANDRSRGTLPSPPGIEPIFIESGPRIYLGDDALARLARTNDEAYLVPGLGIPAVDLKRWELAQTAEHSHWFESSGSGRRVADDRNFDHFKRFGGYDVLSGRVFDQALEVGCGPFTNLRLLASVCEIKSCSLLDPALDSYLDHRTAYYDRENLYIPPPFRSVARAWSRSAPIARRLLNATGRAVPIKDLWRIGAEETPAESADLVVMINVLEHCLDARKIVASVGAAVRPGGFLVVGDKCYSPQVVSDRVRWMYDQAHPLRVSEQVFAPLLDEFRILFESSVRDVEIERYLPETFERYWILQRTG